MSERPSTSGGPSSRKSAKSAHNFDKRISRDDSFLDLRAGRGTGFRPYTPGRGQLPTTPDVSIGSSPANRAAFFPSATMPIPESSNEGKYGEIGMAIGSPTTHRPQKGGTWNSPSSLRPRQTSAPGLSPSSGNSSADSIDVSVPKKQPGKWKLLGLFGRKHSGSSEPAAPTPESTGPKRSYKPAHVEPSVTSFQTYPDSRGTKVGRSETLKERKASSKHKPVVSRSQTMPQIESPTKDQKLRPRDPKITEGFGSLPINRNANNPRPSGSPGSSGPMLNVEIPSITMERYSVMFGSVLQPQPSQQPPLLVRRQATLKKLKSIDDAVEKEEEGKHQSGPRRRDSVQPAKSPGFALFPSTPSNKPRNLGAPRSSPHLRSNTSPALLPSPSRDAFEHTPSSDEPPAYNHLKHPPPHHSKSKLTIATLSRAREQQGSLKEYNFSNDSSILVDSPSSLDSPIVEVARMEPLRPSAHYMPPEPKWQILNSSQITVSTAISVSSDRKRSPSSAASSAPTNLTQISTQDIEEARLPENDGNPTLNPVEISIARQISISRQQQKMLQPLRAKAAAAATSPSAASCRSAGSPAKTSPLVTGGRMAIASSELLAVAETKTLTPTVVHPADPWDLQLAHNRKSERVILEGSTN
ncbi:hypothetical protein F5X96DRAFT_611467 [Biscogniauxia mediterranea]|nr:hypothetical protein F5X96DRAFT_611467 [Biscogniauxia mediterranea]